MARISVILIVLFVAFTIFAFIDCIRTEESRIRALPRVIWVVLILLISPFGGILWFALGKASPSRESVGARRSRAPDDDPEFLRRLGEDKQRDARIRELEARLAELDDDKNDPKDK